MMELEKVERYLEKLRNAILVNNALNSELKVKIEFLKQKEAQLKKKKEFIQKNSPWSFLKKQ